MNETERRIPLRPSLSHIGTKMKTSLKPQEAHAMGQHHDVNDLELAPTSPFRPICGGCGPDADAPDQHFRAGHPALVPTAGRWASSLAPSREAVSILSVRFVDVARG
jgi:hypothetical protein